MLPGRRVPPALAPGCGFARPLRTRQIVDHPRITPTQSSLDARLKAFPMVFLPIASRPLVTARARIGPPTASTGNPLRIDRRFLDFSLVRAMLRRTEIGTKR